MNTQNPTVIYSNWSSWPKTHFPHNVCDLALFTLSWRAALFDQAGQALGRVLVLTKSQCAVCRQGNFPGQLCVLTSAGNDRRSAPESLEGRNRMGKACNHYCGEGLKVSVYLQPEGLFKCNHDNWTKDVEREHTAFCWTVTWFCIKLPHVDCYYARTILLSISSRSCSCLIIEQCKLVFLAIL